MNTWQTPTPPERPPASGRTAQPRSGGRSSRTSRKIPGNPEAAPQSVPMQKLQPAIKINASAELKEVGLEQLPSNLNEIAAQGRITLTASNGEEIEIKADNWSGFGKMFNKNVSYLLIDQSRIAATALM